MWERRFHHVRREARSAEATPKQNSYSCLTLVCGARQSNCAFRSEVPWKNRMVLLSGKSRKHVSRYEESARFPLRNYVAEATL